ncbi:hypothetical protein M404DRAFT_1000214 [Pisolithus tinctorius Marx 270]|uniref:Uncharacterized protein n=1 Tax=Pisolithus tinctorius Marx 270 TaxID=870435 RepID=A0A0C3NWI6_PISTI|nr:hypothetical protein M404DRAFT_1000214 [Pisolithus tinctorius Marx 270]
MAFKYLHGITGINGECFRWGSKSGTMSRYIIMRFCLPPILDVCIANVSRRKMIKPHSKPYPRFHLPHPAPDPP